MIDAEVAVVAAASQSPAALDDAEGAAPPEAIAQALRRDWGRGLRAQAAARAKALAHRYPRSSLINNILGVTAGAKGEFAAASRYFAAAAEGEPADPACLLNLARCRAAMGDDLGAVEAFRRFAARNPERRSGAALVDEARALLRLDRAAEAARRLIDAIDLGARDDAQAPAAAAALAMLAETAPVDGSLPAGDVEARALTAALLRPKAASPRAARAAARMIADALRAPKSADTLSALSEPLGELLVALLSEALVEDAALEGALIAARRDRLARVVAGDRLDAWSARLLEAMALHAARAGWLWSEDDAERGMVDGLARRIDGLLGASAPVPMDELSLLGAYRPLTSLPALVAWAAAVAAVDPTALSGALGPLLLDPIREQHLVAAAPQLTPIDGLAVAAAMLAAEAAPRPSWRKTRGRAARRYGALITEEIGLPPGEQARLFTASSRPVFLIAGHDAGRRAAERLDAAENAQALGLELSRLGVAYAMRQTAQLGLEHAAYAYGDILALRGLDERFDVVEAYGALDRAADLTEALSRLAALTRPGGFLRVDPLRAEEAALRAQFRALVADAGLGSTPAGLRGARAILARSCPTLARRRPRALFDASALFELGFGPDAAAHDVRALVKSAADLGLTVVGFALPAPARRALADLAACAPSKLGAVGADRVDALVAVERTAPETLGARFGLWLRKPEADRVFGSAARVTPARRSTP